MQVWRYEARYGRSGTKPGYPRRQGSRRGAAGSQQSPFENITRVGNGCVDVDITLERVGGVLEYSFDGIVQGSGTLQRIQ